MKQLIKEPTRIESLLDHVLTNCDEKISQSGVIPLGLSDHELGFCTRKLLKAKFHTHKHVFSRSMKSYSQEKLVELLSNEPFPDYSQYVDINDAYDDFVGRLSAAINKVAPMKKVRVKQGSPVWFDGEILEKIRSRDKLLRKYKKSKLQVDRNLYTEARRVVQNLIKHKKTSYFEEQLRENVGKPKEIWQTLKSLGLEGKAKSSADANISLKKSRW